MTDSTPPKSKPRPSWRLPAFSTEFAAAAVLSLAGLMTTWASYQAALWDGDQAASYSRANATRTSASLSATQAGQLMAVDVFLFTQWLDAYAANDEKVQRFYRIRFRPEFEAAFEPWLACEKTSNPKCPKTPMIMPQYKLGAAEKAGALQTQADALYSEGQTANEVSDKFVRVSVIMATALFFAGICQVFKSQRLRMGLIAIAVLACAWGVGALIQLPLNHG